MLSTGKERDAETGLDYFGARYMSSAQGRFTSPDPGMAGSDPWKPQSWNAYSYTLNNPLRFTDPDGEAPIDAVTGFFNGFHASYTLGLTRGTGNSDYRLGQQAGAKVAQGLGLIETALGGVTLGGGGAACAGTGVGCALLPATTTGGLALAGHGLTVAATAQVVFNQASDDAPSSSGGETKPTGPKGGDGKPELITNPKHHPNSQSPQPQNAQELFKNSVVDKNGVSWVKDSNGTIHRFSAPSNGQTHWNGSTAGKKPIQERDIPTEIRRQFE